MRNQLSYMLYFVAVMFFQLSKVASASEEFIVGVGTHFAQGKGELSVDLELMRKLGVSFLRDELHWRNVEKKRGVLKIEEENVAYIKAAKKQGIKPLVILDYGNKFYDGGDKPLTKTAQSAFARYCGFVANELKEYTDLFEIWNEWAGITGNTSPGTVESYLTLAEGCYREIKAVHPDSLVLVGSVTNRGIVNGWLEGLVRGGGLGYGDAVSIHPYAYCRRHETPETWYRGLLKAVADIEGVNDGREIKYYITEMGWPSNTGRCGRSEEVAGAYAARTAILAKAIPQVAGIWWYELRDQNWDKSNHHRNFGLIRPDATLKPAYTAMQSIMPILKMGQFVRRVETNQHGVWVLEFVWENQLHWVYWSTGNSKAIELPENNGRRNLTIFPQTLRVGSASTIPEN